MNGDDDSDFFDDPRQRRPDGGLCTTARQEKDAQKLVPFDKAGCNSNAVTLLASRQATARDVSRGGSREAGVADAKVDGLNNSELEAGADGLDDGEPEVEAGEFVGAKLEVGAVGLDDDDPQI